MRFAIFPPHLYKVLRLPRKSDARSYEVLHLSTQNHVPKTEDQMLQNATPLRKSAPGPPNSSDEHVSCTAPATENASLQIFFKCPTLAIVFGNATKPSRFAHFWQGPQSLAPATRERDLNVQKWSEPLVFWTFWLRNVLRATTACTFSTSQLPKVVRSWCVLYILTSTCASRHNSVHFFDISISKNGPRIVCFVHFDFEMCFAPQRRAIFHLSAGQLASAPAALASLLFDPLEPQIIGKTQCFATFLPFRAPASSFFWLFLFSDLLSFALLFSILLLHLCFSSVHIVGSLTSKLPSIVNYIYI